VSDAGKDAKGNEEHPYMSHWWVPGLLIGYEHSFIHQVADFLQGLQDGKPAMPDFCDALRTQYVCDAVLQSARDQKWVSVSQA
jgi:predicted dehydrogenase